MPAHRSHTYGIYCTYSSAERIDLYFNSGEKMLEENCEDITLNT